MPEGHTIHALARDLDRDLAGRVLRVRSPQGRFAPGADVLDGRSMERAEAWGKHLFCWFDADVVHVHLGLVGTFRRTDGGQNGAPDAVRLELSAGPHTWELRGPQTCELVSPADRDRIVERLGPDPLRRSTTRARARFREGLGTDRAIAVALLDQGVIAGIGNVYRAELLFRTGIHPATPATALIDRADGLWLEATAALRQGLRFGRIVTVDPADVGRRSAGELTRDERLYVYKRDGLPCRRCGAPISTTRLGGRLVWWCPACQPAEATP